jgi:hypothetical protein
MRSESGHVVLRAAEWLGLAAAPTFAIMALLTAVDGGSAPNMLCSATQAASPLTGMVPMYVLMSAFHSAPWLKLIWLELISRRRDAIRRSSRNVLCRSRPPAEKICAEKSARYQI